MGDSPGELAQAFQPLGLLVQLGQAGVLGLGPELLALGFGAAVGDVADGGGDEHVRAVADGRQGDLGGEGAAVAAAPGQFYADAYRAGPGVAGIPGPQVGVALPVAVRDEDLDCLADEFGPVVAE